MILADSGWNVNEGAPPTLDSLSSKLVASARILLMTCTVYCTENRFKARFVLFRLLKFRGYASFLPLADLFESQPLVESVRSAHTIAML